MNRKLENNPDYVRAKILLNRKFNTPHDLITYWGFCGPCRESHPSIEDFSEKELDN